MPRPSKRLLAVAAYLISLAASAVQAAAPSEELLPNTTKGFISVGNVDALRENFNKTQLGQLVADPVMQPFNEDLQRQLRNKWLKSHQRLGLTIEDLTDVPGGEVSLAVVQMAKDKGAIVLLADITDHLPQATVLVEKISKNLTSQQYVKSQRTVLETTVTIFDLPKKDEEPARQTAFFIKGDLLAVTDNVKVIEGVLVRLQQPGKDNLATLPAFEYVMKRCGAAAGDRKPHARWFIEPFGLAEVARAARQSHGHPSHQKGPDMLKILKNQGFTAIQGLGGYVNFSYDTYEMLHRTAIYAPGASEAAEKFQLAARMMLFPNGGDFMPHAWVPRSIATYASFNWDMKNAFEYSKTLVNEYVGDEVFEDVLQQILEDPNGPQIDIRKELINHLGGRATIVSDYQLPITPKSERMLLAAETTNEKAMAAAIEKAMKSDPDAKRVEIGEHVVWVIVDQEAEAPEGVTIEAAPAFAPSVPAEDEEEEKDERHMPPNSAVTVAFGHLLVCTNIDFLTKILTANDAREQLVNNTDYKLIKAELDKVADSRSCAHTFSRTDEEFRSTYELIRAGRMPEAKSVLGRLLNAMWSEGKPHLPRAQRIDGSKLPDYEAVRRYFGPAGATIATENDGWFITGFTLNRETQ